MGRALSGYDKGLLIFAIILFCLAVSSLSVTGVLSSSVSVYGYYIYSTHFGVGAWILLIAIIAIVAGATGSQGAYIAVIVLTVLGTLSAVGGIGVGIYAFVVGAFVDFSFNNDIDGLLNNYQLTIGLVVIDSLTFIFLIVASCIACCGTCNQPHNVNNGMTTTVMHTSTGGAVVMQPAPGYSQYPPQQGYAYPNDGYYNYNQVGAPAGTGGGAVPMNQYPGKS